MRRFRRSLWPLVLIAAMLCGQTAGCKKEPERRVPTPRSRFTPRITNPPPRPTVTMPPGVTRIPVAE